MKLVNSQHVILQEYYIKMQQACDFSGFLFTNLPLPKHCLERREVATKEGNKEVACIVSEPLISCLWGCGESVNPTKWNIREVQGALSSRPKGDPGPLPIFQNFLTVVKSHPWCRHHHFTQTQDWVLHKEHEEMLGVVQSWFSVQILSFLDKTSWQPQSPSQCTRTCMFRVLSCLNNCLFIRL